MVEIKKGENISLLKIIPHINEIIVAIKWLKKTADATEFEIDTSAFLLTEQNKTRNDADFIFYNQPTASDNTIILKNNLFKITLNSIPEEINKISFALTLHNAKQKQQSFGMLDSISIELFNFADKQKLASYIVNDAKLETAIILGLLYRYNNEWKFRAIGQGYIEGLNVLAKKMGVNIEEEIQPQQIQNPVEKTADKETNVPHTDKKSKQSKSKKFKQPKPTVHDLENQKVDIHNTDMMTKAAAYEPIVQWFKQKNFIAEINPAAMDTSGFFDEVAVELGDNYDLLKVVSNTIKRRQVDKHTAYINFENGHYNSTQIEAIKKFCKQLYKYSFVAKYLFNAEENKIILHLQSAVKIVSFFNGEWLEWYAFMKIAIFCHQRKINFSCTRNIIINLPDNSKYELDVFCLIDEMPLFIECKSGEYPGFIDKYSRLRKKMLMEKAYFWFLTSGETDEQVKGLTAMFDITFLNEKMLDNYCEDVFVKKNT